MTENEITVKGVLSGAPQVSDSEEQAPTLPVTRLADLDLNRLFLVALRITRDVPTSRDVAQSVCMQLLELPRTEMVSIRCLQAYADRMARNLALNWLRSKRTWDNLPHDPEDPTLYQRDDPALRLSNAEEAYQLLKQLSEGQRVVLLLCRVHGYSADEVARMLDTTVYAVQKKLQRAVERLERLISEPPRPPSRIRRFFQRKEQP